MVTLQKLIKFECWERGGLIRNWIWIWSMWRCGLGLGLPRARVHRMFIDAIVFYLHSHNKVDDSIMKKRDTRTGPGNLMAGLSSARPATPPGKRSFFRKFVPFMSKHDQEAMTSSVNVGEFFMVVTYLLYQLALTDVGHSATSLPFDRPPTPPAKSSNLTPFPSTENRRATTSVVNIGEFCYSGNISVVRASSYWCRSFSGELAF